MGIIAWIVVGLIAGVIANFITGSGHGIVMSVILGIVGAIVGGFIASAIFNASDVTGINIYSIVVSVLGAIVVIVVARLFTQMRSRA
jgi:uncharacterized membrane protein YeaQ/YmgE (transglycosylase-associated protein family)